MNSTVLDHHTTTMNSTVLDHHTTTMNSAVSDLQTSVVHTKPYPVLQEFAPQTKLLSMIPLKAQKMLHNIDINLTCVDVWKNYIAVGSSIGIVYLYHRETENLLKLRNEDYKNSVTCVKLLVSLEVMVLCGTAKGVVTAFKIPFSDESQMEKFTVVGLHNGPITALEWSSNGIKFFSGDSSGVVICTEIDHLEHCSSSQVVMNEEESIVQLSYTSMILLVSTVKRSVLCHFEDNKFYQVGQRARKFAGRFGAVFFTKNCDVLYASRPGFYIWKSDFRGFIMETMIFKDALNKPHQHIHLQTETMSEKYADFQFGPLRIYNKKYLVTWSGNMLVVIDPELSAIVSSCSVMEPIVDVAATENEIFLIEGSRLLRRIATKPETAKELKSPDISKEELNVLRFETKLPSLLVVKEKPKIFDWLKSKLSTPSAEQESKDNTSQEDPCNDNQVLPEIVKLDSSDCLPLQLTTETLPVAAGERTKEIANEVKLSLNTYPSKSDDIVVRHKKKKKKKEKNKKGKTEVPHGVVTGAGTELSNRKNVQSGTDISVPSTDTANEINSQKKANEDSNGSVVDITATLPISECTDSPSKVELGSESLCKNSLTSSVSSAHPDELESGGSEACALTENNEQNYKPDAGETEAQNCELDPGGIADEKSEDRNLTVADKDTDGDIYSRRETDTDNAKLGTASDNSPVKETELSIYDDSSNQMTDSINSNESTSSDIPQYSTDWAQYKAPGPVVSLSISDSHIFCVDSSECLYMSKFPGFGLSWEQLNQPAHQVAVSPSEAVVWVLYNKTVYAASHESQSLTESEWWPVVRDVFFIAVNDDCAWYVTTTGKLMMFDLSFSLSSHVEVFIPWLTIRQVACSYEVVWVLNAHGDLYCRQGIYPGNKSGTDWKKIDLPELPSGTSITSIGLGDNKIGWIVDSTGTIWFRAGVSGTMPDGFNTLWQVETSECLYQSQSQVHKAVWKVISSSILNNLINGEQQVFIAAGEKGVWFSKAMEAVLYANQKNVIGHALELVTLKGCSTATKWHMLSSGNLVHNQGRVWCIEGTGDLFCFTEPSRNPVAVELPTSDPISCLETTPESVWLVTSKGAIYMRREISLYRPHGVWWQELNLDQLGDINLAHVSCSSEIVWACDYGGQVYVRVGTLNPPTGPALTQAWIAVDCDVIPPTPKVKKFPPIAKQFPLPLVRSAKHKASIVKVYVGPKSYMVWALDDRNNVYVREGVNDSLLIGKQWSFVPGLHAKELCLSKDTVWALKPSGKIFRRYGITESTLMGDYWKQIPGKLSSNLSVTIHDDLWGLSDGSIYHHTSFPIQHHQPPQRKVSCGLVSDDDDGDDWENLVPSSLELNY